MSIPFAERGGRLRGGIDLLAGRLPRFIFGGRVGRLLPVFHFHDEVRTDLEPKLRYLADNGYQAVTSDDIAAYVREARAIPDRAVALCFDDAWASVWTTTGPLLQQYGLKAIVYAIPGRTVDAPTLRPQTAPADATVSPFMTWPELRQLQSAGTIDVQSHTFSHAMIDTAATPTAFIDPKYGDSSFLGRPLLDEVASVEETRPRPSFAAPEDLGAPLYPARSGMSDAPRVRHARVVRDACLRLVQAEGGRAFFEQPGWQQRLMTTVAAAGGTHVTETEGEQRQRIERELDDARAELNGRLRVDVRHVCLPWGVSGHHTEAALKRLGFSTAIANRMPGQFAIRPGDDPYWLKRLPNRYIYRLPGDGRRWWFQSRP